MREEVGAQKHSTYNWTGSVSTGSGSRGSSRGSQRGPSFATDGGRSADRQHESAEGTAAAVGGGDASGPMDAWEQHGARDPGRLRRTFARNRTTSGNARYVASGRGPVEPLPAALPAEFLGGLNETRSCCLLCASGAISCDLCTCHAPLGDLVPARASGGLQAVRAQAQSHPGGATLRSRTSEDAPARNDLRHEVRPSCTSDVVPPSVLLRARLPRPAPRPVGPAAKGALTRRVSVEESGGRREVGPRAPVVPVLSWIRTRLRQ